MNSIFPKLKNKSSNSPKEKQLLYELIDELYDNEKLSKDDYLYVLDHMTEEDSSYLFKRAFEKKEKFYGNKVYLRGLIEISNYCKMGCKYCGINYKVDSIERYRLTKEQIIQSCAEGYELGYRTFVLQGGEDSFYKDNYLVDLLSTLKKKYTDIRITLSLGERSKESYQKLYDAGADRYLLRHETASRRLYNHLHASFMSFDHRRECLKNLKEIGYQVGGGMMIGSPTQTNEDLVKDLLYLKELEPHMVGVGPYLCHSDTELAGNDSGTLIESLVMVAMVRLTLPKALLPSTTALGTLSPIGREKALKAGANVMMPNISPTENRIKYEIYQNKICTTDTELAGNDSGTLIESLVMVAMVRLVLPKALLPSTTALGTLSPIGREKALKAGANVMMPNISPTENRIKYEIYQNKICTTDTSGQCRNCIEGRIVAFGHEIDLGVGDYIGFERKD